MLLALGLMLLISGCSSRQQFSQETQTKSNWWYCAEKTARSWNCADSRQALEKQQASQMPASEPPLKLVPALEPELPSESELPPEQSIIRPESSVEPVVLEQSLDDLGVSESVKEVTLQKSRPKPLTAAEDNASLTTAENKQGDWLIQIGAFRQQAQAERLRKQVPGAQVESFNKGSQTWYRVYLGYYLSRQAATEAAAALGAYQTWIRRRK